jgi:hypothetical protein
LRNDIANGVVEKIIKDNQISDVENLNFRLTDVMFSLTDKETPMPIFKDSRTTEDNCGTIKMFAIEFNGNSILFDKAKNEKLTGWNYVYNHTFLHNS